MSNSPIAPDPKPPRGVGSSIMSLFLIVVGVLLLLPGVCALWGIAVVGLWDAGGFIVLWIICFAISAGGIALIRHAVRGA